MDRWSIYQLDDAFDDFRKGLAPGQQVALDAYVDLLREKGNLLAFEGGKSRPLVGYGNLFELHPQNIRVFYCFVPGRNVVILLGVLKNQRKLKKRVLDGVARLRDEVKSIGTLEWQRLSQLV
jgi:hypothetical protein